MDAVHAAASDPRRYFEYANSLASAVVLPERRAEELEDLLQAFVFVIPKVPPALSSLFLAHDGLMRLPVTYMPRTHC